MDRITLAVILAIVVGVLATFNWLIDGAQQRVLDGLKVDTLERNEERKRSTQDALQNNNPDRDPNVALDSLRQRQSDDP